MDKNEISERLLDVHTCIRISADMANIPPRAYHVYDLDLNDSTEVILPSELDTWIADHPKCKSRALIPAYFPEDIIDKIVE